RGRERRGLHAGPGRGGSGGPRREGQRLGRGRQRGQDQRGAGARGLQGDLQGAARALREPRPGGVAGFAPDPAYRPRQGRRGRGQAQGRGLHRGEPELPAADHRAAELRHLVHDLGPVCGHHTVPYSERAFDLQRHPTLDLRPPQGDRGDEARRRLGRLREDPVRYRRADTGPPRRGPRRPDRRLAQLSLRRLVPGRPHLRSDLRHLRQHSLRPPGPRHRRRRNRSRRKLPLRHEVFEEDL
ncbi:MAG: Assymetric_cell_division_FstX, partial [uncultured Rubrobacteraceae bacterium]